MQIRVALPSGRLVRVAVSAQTTVEDLLRKAGPSTLNPTPSGCKTGSLMELTTSNPSQQLQIVNPRLESVHPEPAPNLKCLTSSGAAALNPHQASLSVRRYGHVASVPISVQACIERLLPRLSHCRVGVRFAILPSDLPPSPLVLEAEKTFSGKRSPVCDEEAVSDGGGGHRALAHNSCR